MKLASGQTIPSNFNPTVDVEQMSGNPASLQYLSQEVTLQSSSDPQSIEALLNEHSSIVVLAGDVLGNLQNS